MKGFKTFLGVCALAAGGLTSAHAADLGGDCCADLEERIAELEATAARKGNRKVSLTVSGTINEAVFFWDDGVESNAYVGTNSLEQSRVRFVGDAKIVDGWSAGYNLEIGFSSAPSSTFSQDNAGGPDTINMRRSNWYVKSKTWGRLLVGLEGTATYHVLDDADAVNTRNYSDEEGDSVAQGSFKVRSGGNFVNDLQWKDFLQGVNNDTPGQNGRRNIVRYDSPEIAGFVLTASWGEDDMAGVSLSYKAEVGDFRIVARGGYEQNRDEGSSACSKAESLDCYWWAVGGTIVHVPTGLFVYSGYGRQVDPSELTINAAADNTDEVVFIQAGIEQKWFSLGKTTVFGEYREDNAGSNLDKSFLGAPILKSDIEFWAGGIVQNIENAAMDLYVIYHHADGSSTNLNNASIDFDEFHLVTAGARIQF